MRQVLLGMWIALAGMPVLADTAADKQADWYQRLLSEPHPEQAKENHKPMVTVRVSDDVVLGFTGQLTTVEPTPGNPMPHQSLEDNLSNASYQFSVKWRF
ncbi:hypothetical protein [Gallaecimonas mangrovi]|uniref:hypothetical protein n=1 Tax=Gallaecimonas mangrovi TaxID=2291597 RepID=UPI000E1FC3B4|nr:hypothetical protein [Gallaecimonas mangrovi]